MRELGVLEDKSLRIEVHDAVSGICPPCPEPDIEFAFYASEGYGYPLIEKENYIMRCRKSKVCALRAAKMELKDSGVS